MHERGSVAFMICVKAINDRRRVRFYQVGVLLDTTIIGDRQEAMTVVGDLMAGF